MKQRTIEEITQALARDLAELFSVALASTEQPAPGPRLYSYDDLSKLLGKAKDTIRQWVCAGEFGEPIKVGNSTRVTQEGLDKFLSDHSGPVKKIPSRARKRTTRAISNSQGQPLGI